MLFDDQFALVVGAELRAVGQAEVSAQHVDALLAARAVGFVGDTGHRVDPSDSDRDIRRAELGGCGAEAFDKSALSQIALTPVGDDQGDHAADTGDNGQCDTSDIDFGGLLGFIDGGDPA
ncbi:hypothetical protein IU429_13675 [Nocardia elegans]|uniref:hypothetical protein n=1 Tax=Nocardia elegans TaxID=300029 RepID=UPI0018940B20|nr:hypothetical protein [Nocardia elegans]MBF6448718.1 hypothetical protein [Nocardia elegans]